jgi:hypothetical protein
MDKVLALPIFDQAQALQEAKRVSEVLMPRDVVTDVCVCYG